MGTRGSWIPSLPVYPLETPPGWRLGAEWVARTWGSFGSGAGPPLLYLPGRVQLGETQRGSGPGGHEEAAFCWGHGAGACPQAVCLKSVPLKQFVDCYPVSLT